MTDWVGYLQHFTEEGFSEEGISEILGENPDSDSVLFVQETLEDAKKLVSMLDKVPKSLNEVAQDMKKRLLRHPSELEEIRSKYNVMIVAKTPWIASAEKMRDQWSMEGRSIELAAWLRRLDSIDHSTPEETKEVVQAIEDVAPRDQVRKAIEKLEAKQRKRRLILQDMINILERRGWKLEFSENANLSEKFQDITELLELEDRIEALEREVIQFQERRPIVANQSLKIIEDARLNADSNAIRRLESDVKNEILDILKSNEEIKNRLNYWSHNGLVITDSEILTNSQLWEFEDNLEEYEKNWELMYEKSIVLQNLLNKSGQKYPDWLGRVDFYEKTLNEIDELTSHQKQMKKRIQKVIKNWKKIGLNLELINGMSEGNNIWKLDEQINQIQPMAEIAISILNSIDHLDQSIDNGRIQEIRESVIQNWHNHDTLQFEIEEVEKISRRQERHLEMLYDRAEYLSLDITEANDWTITEFENRIFSAELTRNRDIEKETKRNAKLNEKIRAVPGVSTLKQKNLKSSNINEIEENKWIEKSAADGRLFYYNMQTKQSTWSKPDGQIQPRDEMADIPITEKQQLVVSEIEDISEENETQSTDMVTSKEETIVVQEESISVEKSAREGRGNPNHVLRKRMGIEDSDPLIVESSRTRDLRIQRILRLIPLIEEKIDADNQKKIVDDLLPLLENIEKWIRVRSEYRRCWNDQGGIIQKMDRLQSVLDDVPGPGIQLPIGFDRTPLPSTAEELVEEIKDFSTNALVSTSGGIIAL